jgi:hypothetical protein
MVEVGADRTGLGAAMEPSPVWARLKIVDLDGEVLLWQPLPSRSMIKVAPEPHL